MTRQEELERMDILGLNCVLRKLIIGDSIFECNYPDVVFALVRQFGVSLVALNTGNEKEYTKFSGRWQAESLQYRVFSQHNNRIHAATVVVIMLLESPDVESLTAEDYDEFY